MRRSAAIALAILLAVGCERGEPDAGQPASAPTTTATAATLPSTTTTLAVKDVSEDCMDPWDGNYNALEDLIRPQLSDPGSMETFGTYYCTWDDLDDGLVLDYGAPNAFGGMVRTSAWA